MVQQAQDILWEADKLYMGQLKKHAVHAEMARKKAARRTHGGGKHGGHNQLQLERRLNLADEACGLDVSGQEGGEQAADNASGRDEQRVAHGCVDVL